MNVDVVGVDTPEWAAAVQELDADVYHLAEYHRACELNREGAAQAFVARDGARVFFHPFLVRRIDSIGAELLEEEWYDLESVYGYSGPLSTTDERSFLSAAWALFGDWCAENRVVAEFVRFNPLLGNAAVAAGAFEVALDRQTVALTLDRSDQELWRGYPSTQRNMVRKARSAGVEIRSVPLASGLDDFRRLYAGTMERLQADERYSFSDAYLEHLAGPLGEKVILKLAALEGRIVAAAMFLLHGLRMHYHLAAGDPAFRSVAAGNLLLHEAAEWGRERGYTVLHLGGGRTPRPDDSLFRFKESISRERLPFFTGRVVHDQQAYASLCNRWIDAASPAERPSYFLLYRLSPVA